MNEDPRRMWIYGVCIFFVLPRLLWFIFFRQVEFEDNLIAVHYFSRVHAVRTDTFDYVEVRKQYLCIQTRIMYLNSNYVI